VIVLDEHLEGLGLETFIARWYPGKVIAVRALRGGTIVKDDVIPTLLRHTKQPTFVTINWTDFWRQFPADKRYCIICFPLARERVKEIPSLLRQVLKLSPFKTKAGRMGTVVRVTKNFVQYYRINDPRIHTINFI
jgi:hypothetical protein